MNPQTVRRFLPQLLAITILLPALNASAQRTFGKSTRATPTKPAITVPPKSATLTQPKRINLAMNERVSGGGQLSLNGVLSLDHKWTDSTINSAEILVEDVRRDTQLSLSINGIELDRINVRAGQRGMVSLKPPFRILKDADTAIDLTITGDAGLREVAVLFQPDPHHHGHDNHDEGAQTTFVKPIPSTTGATVAGTTRESTIRPTRGTPRPDRGTGTTTPAPHSSVFTPRDNPRTTTPSRTYGNSATRGTTTATPKESTTVDRLPATLQKISGGVTHWGTRSATEYRETMRLVGERGDGALDGWDFPDWATKLDGRNAIFRGGDVALALHHHDIFNTPFRRLDRVKLTVTGEGIAKIALSPRPFVVAQSKVVTLEKDTPAIVEFTDLNLSRANVQQLEVAISGDKQEIEIDGLTFEADVTR